MIYLANFFFKCLGFKLLGWFNFFYRNQIRVQLIFSVNVKIIYTCIHDNYEH
jgi:hypothetical protein